jgi:citrate lyase subunit beta/citryl-CoA lyase
MLAKARALEADEVFLDLEDAVAPNEKTDATRALVVEALLHDDWRAATRVVRINDVSTHWCHRDIEYVVAGAGAHLDCIMVPKVEDVSHVHFVSHFLDQLERAHGISRRIGLEVQIETARGLVEVERIATASDRIETLIFGPGDFAASMGIPQLTVGVVDEAYLGHQWHYVLSRIVTAARANGLQAIDGPYAAIRDPEGFRRVATLSRLLGYDGKWAIHPDQIAICNEVYSPTAAELERAEQILSVYARATDTDGQGAVVLEQEMIDEATRKMASSVVERGRAARS